MISFHVPLTSRARSHRISIRRIIFLELIAQIYWLIVHSSYLIRFQRDASLKESSSTQIDRSYMIRFLCDFLRQRDVFYSYHIERTMTRHLYTAVALYDSIMYSVRSSTNCLFTVSACLGALVVQCSHFKYDLLFSLQTTDASICPPEILNFCRFEALFCS